MPPKIDPTGSEIDPHRGGGLPIRDNKRSNASPFQLGIIKEAIPPP